MELTEKVKAIAERYVRGRAAAAVSGGRDSMCLLDCLVRFGIIDPSELTVLHVNHMIRGEDADADEELVAAFCRDRGIRFECARADVPALAKAHGRSLETEARIVRRGVFSAFGGVVMTAHNKNDRTESVLMHIFRGCGINGLTGPTECDGFLVRPLIGCGRDEIDEYVRRYRVPYSDDATNSECDYARNYVRHKILPLVRSRYPGADDAIARLGDAARLACGALGAAEKIDGGAFVKTENVTDGAMLAAFISAGLSFDYTSAHIKAAAKLAGARTGAGIDLPHGYRAEKESGGIRVFVSENIPDEEKPFVRGLTRFALGRYVAAEPTEAKADRRGCVIDADKLPSGAVIRTRRAGDTFMPCGGVRKSLSDWLIDKKVPRYERERLLCVALGGEVLAIAGMATGAALAVDGNTKNALRLTSGRTENE